MQDRIQKLLSAAGVASRRKAEELIKAGRVTVNGVRAELGQSADPEIDELAVDGTAVNPGVRKVYIALYKPRGYLSAVSDSRGRKTVSQLVEGCGARVYPVGRLDMESEGLLLMTNDGDFANKLTHPRFEKDKTYVVSVRGNTDLAYPRLSQPIEIDGKMTQGAQVSLISSDGAQAKIAFTIHEGKNRQVRRICEAAELTVTRLVRVSEGCVSLEGLHPGKWRNLTEQELRHLTKPGSH